MSVPNVRPFSGCPEPAGSGNRVAPNLPTHGLIRWGFLVGIACGGLMGCSPTTVETSTRVSDHPQHSGAAKGLVNIRKPAGAPVVETGIFDAKGNPVTISCATCHTTKPPEAGAKLGKPLVLYHQQLTGSHGNLTCLSCHNSTDGYASLRLADGKSVPYSEVMTLCSQCHGQQARDYEHGAHGGMTGHWDQSKGTRERNNCVDCHKPHTPKYPTVMPVRGPNDRFQTGEGHE